MRNLEISEDFHFANPYEFLINMKNYNNFLVMKNGAGLLFVLFLSSKVSA